MTTHLARHSDTARVTGVVEPFDGERWQVTTRVAESGHSGSLGSLLRRPTRPSPASRAPS